MSLLELVASATGLPLGPKRLGERRYEEGFRPKYPVVLIPGLRGVALKAVVSPIESWKDTSVWLSLDKLQDARNQNQLRRQHEPQTESIADFYGERNQLIRHVGLAPDLCGTSDPDGTFGTKTGCFIKKRQKGSL